MSPLLPTQIRPLQFGARLTGQDTGKILPILADQPELASPPIRRAFVNELLPTTQEDARRELRTSLKPDSYEGSPKMAAYKILSELGERSRSDLIGRIVSLLLRRRQAEASLAAEDVRTLQAIQRKYGLDTQA